MKTPSLFAASGNAPSKTLADQVERERSIGEAMDPVRRNRARLADSLVQLLRQSTTVKNSRPGT